MIDFLKIKISKKVGDTSSGFTLVEMIVVVAIFAILTAIIIFNYGEFNDQIIVTNMSYEIALTTRQAQIFGLGVRGTGGDFQKSYGIFADISDTGETKDFIFFEDFLDDDRLCKDGSSNDCDCVGENDECLEKMTMQRNIVIDKLLAYNNITADCDLLDKLSVTYKRPNPEAKITDQDNAEEVYTSALIRVSSPRDVKRYVFVNKTGQISVLSDLEADSVTSDLCPI